MGVVWGMGSVGIFVEVDHLAWTSYREIPTGCLRRRDGCRSVCLAGWLVMGCAQAKRSRSSRWRRRVSSRRYGGDLMVVEVPFSVVGCTLAG